MLDVLVFIKEALDVSGAEVPLVHHLRGPPGVLGRAEYRLRLPTGSASPEEQSVRTRLLSLHQPGPLSLVELRPGCALIG